MKCVVGNCMSPMDDVKRCYWSKMVGMINGNIGDHAYLDLCSFHQGMFKSHECSAWSPGWDALEG